MDASECSREYGVKKCKRLCSKVLQGYPYMTKASVSSSWL